MSRVRIVIAFAAALVLTHPAVAQKPGGTLRVSVSANPSSMSIHEEVAVGTTQSVMGVFNNLVMFDPTKLRNSEETLVPDLAESWSWDASGTKLTFQLRQGVKWHDGKPFTARDVKCTWDRITGKEPDYFRRSPRKVWYQALKEVSVDSEHQATFHLDRPQPSLLLMLASGMSPVYPCHVEARVMRTHPIGTGPFKFVDFKSNERILLTRNPDYWKKGLPYLDAVETRVMPNRATRMLALTAGEIDMTPAADITVPLLKDLEQRAPQVVCQLRPTNVTSNVLINKARAPFDNPQVRRAVALGLDRQGFILTMSQGQATIAGNMQPPPEGLWGMTKEELDGLLGYAGTFAERHAEALKIMTSLGHGLSNRLKIKVSVRDFASYKDGAAILADQLNKLYFDAEVEIIESTIWFGRAARQDYAIAYNITSSGLDEPDVVLVENYACNSDINFTKYCNPDVDKLLVAQSSERDRQKRRALVSQIERVLAEEVARPIIQHGRSAQCWQASVKGMLRQENSIHNHWRLEQVWLDK